MNILKETRRILSLVLAICLLAGVLPSLAIADSTWKTRETPYGAKLKAGTVLYADEEMEREAWILKEDALVRVTETRPKTAKVEFTVKKQPKSAWVDGELLQPVDLATPTDLDAVIVSQDVILNEVEESLEEQVPMDIQPEETPIEAEPEQGDPSTRPDGLGQDDNPAGSEPAQPEATNPQPVISSEVEKSPSVSVSTEPEPEESNLQNVILSEVEESIDEQVPTDNQPEETPIEAEPEQGDPSTRPDGLGQDDNLAGSEPSQPEEAPIASEDPEPEIIEDPETEIIEEPETLGSLQEELPETELLPSDVMAVSDGIDESSETTPATVYALAGDGTMAASSYINPNLPASRNQNPYGTCWSFSTIGGLELDLIRDKAANTSIDLSEFFLIYYSGFTYANPKGGKDEIYSDLGAILDAGGNVGNAAYYLSVLIGTTTEADNPYQDPANRIPANIRNIAAQITGAYELDTHDRDLIKNMILAHGGVSASINANDDVLVQNARGDWTLYSTSTYTNHAILLVGWDDSYAVSNFQTPPPGPGAWYARNSWGNYKSYFWISYYDAGLLSRGGLAYDAQNTGMDNFVYTYAADASYSYKGGGSDQAVAVQEYTVDAQEQITAVGVDVATPGITISARVLVNGKEAGVTKSRKAAQKGIYRLPLVSPVLMTSRDTVAVEVTYIGNGKDYIWVPYQPIGVEDRKNKEDQTVTVRVHRADGSGFTLNGRHYDEDSTIRLYTKQKSSAGLVRSITLSRTTLSLKTGEYADLKATIEPSNATNKTLTWTSSSPEIAYMDGNGRVVGGTKTGTALITAMSSNGVYASCRVTVTWQEVAPRTLYISSDLFDAGTKSYTIPADKGLRKGDKLILRVTSDPAYTSDFYTWTTSNLDVIGIGNVTRNDCEVILNGSGKVRITLSAVNHPEISTYVDLNVNLYVPATWMQISAGTLKLPTGETYQITANLLPENATDQTVTWTSSDSTVATVDKTGLVTAVKSGEATITASAEGGSLTLTCDVTVIPRAESVTLDTKTQIVGKGNSVVLNATVNPSDAWDQRVTWSSSDKKIATVNSSGVVTGVKEGTADITVTTVDGGLTDTCTVTVQALYISSDLFDAGTKRYTIPADKGLRKGDKLILRATSAPAGTSDSYTWASSNVDVISLGDSTSNECEAVLNDSGKVRITLSNADYPEISTYVDLTVNLYVPATWMQISAGTLRLPAGDTYQITAKLLPKDATDPTVTWTSSDPEVAEVDQTGLVTAVKSGDATITASAEGGSLTLTCEVTVIPRAESVTLDTKTKTLKEGDSFVLNATVSPSDAWDQRITWSSSDKRIAKVNSDGLVTGVKEGTADITVTTVDGGLTDTCTVTIETTDPIKAFVYRMYRICLLREPDEGGFNGWVSALRSGTATGSQLAYGFLNSDEMIGRNLSDGDFVERNYEAIMGRASDAGGKQGWVDALAAGMSRKAVISGFVKSEEFTNICKSYGIVKGDYASDEARDVNAGVTGFVSRLYTKMLGRAYDPDGLNAWSAAILKAPTAATVLQVSLNGFMHSPEFVNKNLNDTELVKVLYRTFLDREADEGGLSAWVQALRQGNDRDTVAAGFANSPEFAAIMAKYGF